VNSRRCDYPTSALFIHRDGTDGHIHLIILLNVVGVIFIIV